MSKGVQTYYSMDVQNYFDHLSKVADVLLLGYQKISFDEMYPVQAFHHECASDGSTSNSDRTHWFHFRYMMTMSTNLVILFLGEGALVLIKKCTCPKAAQMS